MGYSNYSYYREHDVVDFSTLLGKTFDRVVRSEEFIEFDEAGGETYRLMHFQDCCEWVYVEDVAGDLADLLGSPILQAEEVVDSDWDGEARQRRETRLPPKESYDESYTWTYYKLATIKGSVTIRFYGSSNGYYSESVHLARMLRPS